MIFDAIQEWFQELLIDGIISNLTGMFDTLNTKVGEIAGEVGMTPSAWNSGIFNMVRNLSETVIVPIAGIVLTFVMCYELIQLIVEKNNLHDFDTWIFFKWIFKTFCAVLIVTNTWNIVMAVFDVAQNVVSQSAGVIISDAGIDISGVTADLETQLADWSIGALLGLWFQSIFVGLCTQILSICIFLVIYGRMIEVYLVTSIGPIRNEEVQEHITPEKMTVLVVEPMKKPYVKEIDPGLHSLQAEVGGDIATAYPFSDPVGLVCNDEGKLIGLELNRGLRDEHGEIYDIMAGTFLVVGLSEDSFTSLTPEQVQKYTEHFKQPEQFISLNGQIIALPAEPENPLRTAEMTLEDDYGMIDGVLNNGRKGEEQEKAQGEAHRGAPEKRPSIRERLAEAKRECGERKPPDRAQQKKPPEHDL